MGEALARHFQAIWLRALNAVTLDAVTPELVVSWATERGIESATAEARSVGPFNPIDGIVLSVGEVKAFFPKMSASDDPAWLVRHQAAEAEAALWDKVEWFTPFWVAQADVWKFQTSVEHASKEQAVQLFDYHMSTTYTLAFQAVCIAQIMPLARSLREKCPLAREAYLAFYSGYRASSIAALIPVIEGGITCILPDRDSHLAISEKVDRAIDGAIATAASVYFDHMWVPKEYRSKSFLFAQDERVFGFETYRRWLQRSFFQNSGEYNGTTWLNRHVFAHGVGAEWQSSANFTRLIIALATLGLVESWHDASHTVSLFLPAMNDDSTLLWQQAQFQAQAQMSLKLLEQQRYQEQGRLVPEMPTDDGAALRRAILSDDCIKDLVRPLRDAGWSIDVEEPEETGLFMKVAATAGGAQFRAALLYSCATATEIYRELSETCHVILYRGAPYSQSQFAHGISVHVGPVTGWQPPSPRHHQPTPP